MRLGSSPVFILAAGVMFAGCSGSDSSEPSSPGVGGVMSVGGSTGASTLSAIGGATPTSGMTTAGVPVAGGSRPFGGSSATGGTAGVPATGGSRPFGGSSATGGTATFPATGGSSAVGGSSSDVKRSSGCGKSPPLKNSTSSANQNTLTVSGASRQYLVRLPSNYDNTRPHRLILGFHGAGGKDTDIGPSYFGLYSLAKDSTIFVAPSASGGFWNATSDVAFVDEILKTVEADLCIDTSRVLLEGFSQGGAMVAVLACQRPGVFRAAVGHSRGGLAAPTACQPIPFLGSLGLSDIGGNSQATQTDAFAKWNGCTITTLPLAPKGGHVCTKYTNCPATAPVVFCSFDGPHTASPTDAGKSISWMPEEVWTFLSQF